MLGCVCILLVAAASSTVCAQSRAASGVNESGGTVGANGPWKAPKQPIGDKVSHAMMISTKYTHQVPPGATVPGALDYGPSTHSFRDSHKTKQLAQPDTTGRATALLKTRARARGWQNAPASAQLAACAGLLHAPPAEHMDIHSEYHEPRPFDSALQRSALHPHDGEKESQQQRAVRSVASTVSPLRTNRQQLTRQAKHLLRQAAARKSFLKAYDSARRTGTAPPAVPAALKGPVHRSSQRSRAHYQDGSTKHSLFGAYSPRTLLRRTTPMVQDSETSTFSTYTKRDTWWAPDADTAQSRRLAQIRKAAALHTARYQAAPLEVTLSTNLSTE